MADLSKIKVGDKLKFEVAVVQIDAGDFTYPIGIERGNWLDRVTIEAAEHIPAPRVFKRGDWVKWNHGKADCIHRHCLFIKVVLTEPALAVIDDNGQTFTVGVEQLSHDKAPE